MSWTIILPIILITVPSVLIGAYVTLSGRRRRRTPPELRGDWWARFESDFRAYTERVANCASDNTRRARDRGSPP